MQSPRRRLLWVARPLALAAALGVFLFSTERLAHVSSPSAIATLESLRKVDDLPLYVMHYEGGYDRGVPLPTLAVAGQPRAWACSLFYARGGQDGPLYGRNFDWDRHPALLLFTNPPDGFASVSMVDISYLGYGAGDLARLDSLEGRRGLLDAPMLPFDGMNERGLVVGMAAIPPGDGPQVEGRPTVGSLRMIRLILDSAATTAQAVSLFDKYNVDFSGGPPIHYLIADRGGHSALVELGGGEVHVRYGSVGWQAATNFRQEEWPAARWSDDNRYDLLATGLEASGGKVDLAGAMRLLEGVQQGSTLWSVVYGIESGEVRVATVGRFSKVHRFRLD
jgi:hypothetical protein